MSEVWRRALRGSRLLVALGLADFADDDGRNVYPAVGTVAEKCGLGRRRTQAIMRSLRKDGFLAVETEEPGRTVRYRINVHAIPLRAATRAKIAPVQPKTSHPCTPEHPTHAAGDTGGVQRATPNPSINHQGKPPKEPSPPDAEREASFVQFWASYPKREAKADARKAWAKVKAAEIPAVMAALERHKQRPQWLKDNGEFIPLAATWLNKRRWEDEIQETKGVVNRAEQRDLDNARAAGFNPRVQ